MGQTENDLIRQLERLRDAEERGALAALRRGQGQPAGAVAETSRVVERMLCDNDDDALRDALYIVAPLFALHDAPFSGNTPRWENMGAHFRGLCREGGEAPPNVERRFMALLSSEPDDLPDALRQAVSLLKAGGVAVNWRQLLADVKNWRRLGPDGPQRRRDIRLGWSKSFWAQHAFSQSNGDAAGTTDDASHSFTAEEEPDVR